jgi:glucosamine--fructose-6-phosphate aminotransferase (isomerizing)
VLNRDEPDRLYIARRGSPLVVGLGEGENFVASDIPALLPYTRNVLFLEYEEAGVVTREGVEIWDAEGRAVAKAPTRITWDQTMAEKGGHKHFMIKEILEQPRAIADTLSGRISNEKDSAIVLDDLEPFLKEKGPFESIDLIACGTSYHAGLVGKFWIEEFARIPVNVDLASEYRYRNPILSPQKLVVAVSQSGETADTLAAILEAQKKGAGILSVCNVVGSSIARASDVTLYTRAGPEIGVASTKAFTTQLIVLLLLALHLAERRKTLSGAEISKALEAILHLPEQMGTLLKTHRRIKNIAKKYAASRGFLYFARGPNYPIAYEGALKLKEISYIHAEGYAAGEMKHGPIALIDSDMPVVVVAPRDAHYEKVLSNLEEARARGARIIGVGTEGDEKLEKICEDMIGIPEVPGYLQPLLSVIPLQLLAYYIADHKGTDVDQPRNLAKSVTVE